MVTARAIGTLGFMLCVAAASGIALPLGARDPGWLALVAVGAGGALWRLVRNADPWPTIGLSGLALLVGGVDAPFGRERAGAVVAGALMLLALSAWQRSRYSSSGTIASIPVLSVPIGAVIGLAVALAPTESLLGGLTQISSRLSGVVAGSGSQSRELPSETIGDRANPVMTLGTSFEPGPTAIALVTNFDGERLRARVYDRWTGHTWTQAPSSWVPPTAVLDAGDERYTVTMLTGGQAVLLAPRSRRLPDGARWRRLTDLGDDGDRPDASFSRALTAGATYVVGHDTEARGAAALLGGVPAAVAALYGDSDSVSETIRALAGSIGPGEREPARVVDAIEEYLRGFDYRTRLDPSSVTSHGDPLERFLIETRAGYCDYFASGMALLLRARGIPARVVTGYAGGERTGDGWILREADAHAWVEVYLPGEGWVERDPTPAGPRLAARAATVDGAVGAGHVASSALARDPAIWPSPGATEAFVVLVISVAVAAALARAVWSWGIDRLPVAERGFAKVRRLARVRGIAPRVHETPLEVAARIGEMYPAVAGPIGQLASAYVGSRFGGGRTSSLDVAALDQAWREVRRALLFARPVVAGAIPSPPRRPVPE